MKRLVPLALLATVLHNGVSTGPPIRRGDPCALRSLVQIDAPADGTSTASPFDGDG